MSIYLDSSAVVKLVNREDESTSLRRYLARRAAQPRVVSALARVEVVRAVSPAGQPAMAQARRVLDLLHQVPLDLRVLDSAAALAVPVPLRSLDAIHLASALALGTTLESVVTYDARMATAAEAIGLAVAMPGR